MTARLPTPGGDSGVWDDILTEYLLVGHSSDGTHKGVLGVFNVKDAAYGAVGDGVTDDTAAIQAALTAADQQGSVYLPAGTYRVGALNYRNQRIVGAGMGLSVILGKPSQDVLHGDNTLAAESRQNGSLSHLTIRVDDSVDASASFPQRGGAGNAGLAYDYPNGAAASPLRLHSQRIENVRFESLSGVAANKSTGVYSQTGGYLNTFVNVWFYRLWYGWWGHYPTSNLTSAEFGFDHSAWDACYFNGCKKAGRWVNLGQCGFENLTCHAGTTATGFEFLGVTGISRADCLNVDMANVMIESCASDPLKFTRCYLFDVSNVNIAGSQTNWTVDCDHSFFSTVTLSNATTDPPPIVLTGDHITIDNLLLASVTSEDYGWDQISDLGVGNRVLNVSYGSGSAPRNRIPVTLTRDGRQRHQRDSLSLLMGYTDPPFVSGSDLLAPPAAIVPTGVVEGVGYDYVTDITADLGRALRVYNPGNFYTGLSYLNGERGNVVGQFLPKGRVRVYVKAKAATGGTQTWYLKYGAGATDAGSATLSLTTSYQVLRWDTNLSAATVGDTLQLQADGISSSANVDIAWIMFRPFMADQLITGASLLAELAADPAAPAANTAQFYARDNGSGKTQIVARFPTGVVQVIATEP